MLDFDYFEKGLGQVSPPRFVYDFSRIIFLMLYSINWPNFICLIVFFLEILSNIYITIICFSVYDVIDVKFQYLENGKSF